jgi:hypothetical protein
MRQGLWRMVNINNSPNLGLDNPSEKQKYYVFLTIYLVVGILLGSLKIHGLAAKEGIRQVHEMQILVLTTGRFTSTIYPHVHSNAVRCNRSAEILSAYAHRLDPDSDRGHGRQTGT